MDQWVSGEEGNTFTAKKKLNLRFGNKDASAFHRFKAFCSAIIKDSDIAEAIKESLSQALASGKSLRDWRKDADTVFDAQGVTRLNSWQAERIYRNETSMAYGAGQFAKLQEVSDRYPYWQYATAQDEKVRESHAELHGKIFQSDNSEFYPPIGYNCRCTAIPISRLQAKKRGITSPDTITPEMRANLQNTEFTGDKIGNFRDWLDKKRGTLSQKANKLIIEKLDEIIAQPDTEETGKNT